MSNVQSNPNVKVQNKYRIYFVIWILSLIWHLDFDIWILTFGFCKGLTFAKAKNRA